MTETHRPGEVWCVHSVWYSYITGEMMLYQGCFGRAVSRTDTPVSA